MRWANVHKIFAYSSPGPSFGKGILSADILIESLLGSESIDLSFLLIIIILKKWDVKYFYKNGVLWEIGRILKLIKHSIFDKHLI
jgi:hypothetical protein